LGTRKNRIEEFPGKKSSYKKTDGFCKNSKTPSDSKVQLFSFGGFNKLALKKPNTTKN
jgi:hypothetical protein